MVGEARGKVSTGACKVVQTILRCAARRYSLLATVLAGSGGEDGAKFADEGAGCPEATSLVEEGRDLGGCAAVTGGEAEDEAVEVLEVVGLDDGVLGDGGLMAWKQRAKGGEIRKRSSGQSRASAAIKEAAACRQAVPWPEVGREQTPAETNRCRLTLLPCILPMTSSDRVSAIWKTSAVAPVASMPLTTSSVSLAMWP